MKPRINALQLTAWLAGAVLLVGASGCVGDRYTQSTGQHIDDNTTSRRVRSALADDTQYKFSMVEVTTFKGTTQLSGFVNTREQKDRAGEVARQVEGVRDVENNISVK